MVSGRWSIYGNRSPAVELQSTRLYPRSRRLSGPAGRGLGAGVGAQARSNASQRIRNVGRVAPVIGGACHKGIAANGRRASSKSCAAQPGDPFQADEQRDLPSQYPPRNQPRQLRGGGNRDTGPQKAPLPRHCLSPRGLSPNCRKVVDSKPSGRHDDRAKVRASARKIGKRRGGRVVEGTRLLIR